MQVELTPDQAQMLINCVQYAVQKQIEDGNVVIGTLQAAMAPPAKAKRSRAAK